jgi:hypothetical protein
MAIANYTKRDKDDAPTKKRQLYNLEKCSCGKT